MPSSLSTVQENLLYAHGVLNSVAWGLVFPLGATLIRLLPPSKAWIVHMFVMLFGLIMFTAGVAIGLWQTLGHGYKVSAPHTVMGVSTFALAWTQPLSGLLHHYVLRKYDVRTISSTIHVFLGRLLILSGVVDGGLGLLLKGDSTRAQNVAYGVCCGVLCLAYLLVSLWFEARRDNIARRQAGLEQKLTSSEKSI